MNVSNSNLKIFKNMDSSTITSIIHNLSIKIIIFCLIILWVQYHWNRRKLYICSSKASGPLSLPIIGCSYLFLGGNEVILKTINALTSQYKGLVRFWHCNKLVLATTDPKHIEIILNHPKALSKDKLYDLIVPMCGWGLFTAPVHLWKRNRKLIMPAFNKKILDGYVEVFVKQSNILVEQIEKNCKLENPEEASTLISRCTLDLICETAMGMKGVQAQITENKFPHYIDQGCKVAVERMFNIFYQYEFIFKWTNAYKELKEATDYTWGFTMNIIKHKRAEMEKNFKKKLENNKPVNLEFKSRQQKSFLHLLLEMNLSGQHDFSDVELSHEIMTFMIAGSDTTGLTNCFVLVMLAMHPEIQEKVYEEIIDVVGPDCNIEPRHLPNLQYLERVIKETLRLFPVTLMIFRSADGDIDLRDGHVIPQGTSIAIGMLDTQRSPDNWPQPLVFDPDRFLPENIAKIHPYAYIPFSAGPRNCIGLRYAMLSMKTLLATVLRSFRVTTTYRSVEEIKLTINVMIRPIEGYKIVFHRR